MSIENLLTELKASIDANTAALVKLSGAAPAATGEAKTEKTGKTTKTTEKKDDEPKITQEQMNAALIKLKDDFGMPHAKEIIKESGKAEKMAEIKPAQYKAVYDAAVAKHAELSEGGSAGGDDDGI